MVMRVGGLATGMDIESIVNKLMEAERMPLTRMQQERTMLSWKRDAFRDINTSVLKFQSFMLDMKLSNTYHPKTVTSSQEQALTATADTGVTNGVYEVQVTQLATSAINVSTIDIDPDVALDTQVGDNRDKLIGTHTFFTYDEKGNKNNYHITISEEDTLNDVLSKITKDNNNVRAFYDVQSKQVVLETTRTGNYHKDGAEITFDSDTNPFFTDILGLDPNNEKGGTNATFIYNNKLHLESKENSYKLNGITFEFKNITDGNVRVSVEHDVEASFEAIKQFVDTYNEMIEKMNASQSEERFRDFPPLTEEQKKEMTEEQIKQWEEKAKSGILRRDQTITNGMYTMRNAWYAAVDTDGKFTSLTQIGISTSENYMSGGKLEVDEKKLKEALRDHPEDVQKLFAQRGDDNSQGLVYRLDEAAKNVMKNIERQAGNSSHTLDNYSIGKQMKDLNDRISDFEKRMIQVENRYWNQFTRMEKAIQRMNEQSNYLMSQFMSI